MRRVIGPVRPSPTGRPSYQVTALIPPAVVLVKISSAASTSSARTARISQRSWRSAAISVTVRRVMPSNIPCAGVASTPSFTMKMLKPGPSVMVPSAAGRIATVASRS